MDSQHHDDRLHAHTPHTWRRPVVLALASAALLIAFYALREHWGHVLGILPYLVLLACPLMHFLHGHGGRGHRHRDGQAEAPSEPPQPRS